MSSHVSVYPRAVKDAALALDRGARDAYLENDDRRPSFTDAQIALLRVHLVRRKYIERPEGSGRFVHDAQAEAMLTPHGLYFTGYGSDGTMEVTMTGGELSGFAFGEHFTVHDIQQGDWSP